MSDTNFATRKFLELINAYKGSLRSDKLGGTTLPGRNREPLKLGGRPPWVDSVNGFGQHEVLAMFYVESNVLVNIFFVIRLAFFFSKQVSSWVEQFRQVLLSVARCNW